MPGVSPGEVWMIDFGLAAKVRPAILLTAEPREDELDLVTVLPHTTALRGNKWELAIPKSFLKPGAFHLQQIQTVYRETRTEARNAYPRRNNKSKGRIEGQVEP